MKEGLKKKPKKAKKTEKDASAACETVSDAERYVAGEVCSSLFSKKSQQSATPLSSLFDTKPSSAQPLYVPVVVTKAKRKLPEPDDAKPSKKPPAVPQVDPKKNKDAKRELSISEKRVEDREQALTNADEDEKGKTKKGKNLKSTKNFDEDMTPEEKKRMILAERRVKNKRTVFVGNLPTACTKQMLKSCFKEFGPIESVRFRSVARADPTESRKVAAIHRHVHPKRKSINAYVVFKEQDGAVKALVRNGSELTSGFHIRVDLASKSSSHSNKKTVFVGNLPYDIEEEALREHFSQCGTVEGVRVIRDKNTGIGKGFGYILFQGTDSVLLALKLDKSELMGRKLRIQRCVSNETKGAQKSGGFRQKFQSPKKGQVKQNTFVGETANGAKSKTKQPKQKFKQSAAKPKKKPNKKQTNRK